VITSAYAFPAPLTVAPGQLVTLIVQGLDDTMTKTLRAPAGADLPNSLAGISAGYQQFSLPNGGLIGLGMPILEVHPFSPCNRVALYECVELAAITVQIPLEALPELPQPPAGTGATLGVSDGNSSGKFGEIIAVTLSDQVHILTSCDPFMTSSSFAPLNATGLPCPSIVAHPDGSLVTVKNPAKAGEELVAYAVGLGQTNPPSVTGKLATTSAPTQTTFALDFSFHPNTLPSRPLPVGPPPLFAGTTPGYVGLYQVNFVVPPVPAGTPPCVDTSALPLGSNVVQSNLTVSVGGAYSFDGARICVAVPTS
jgi:hypothetical protein